MITLLLKNTIPLFEKILFSHQYRYITAAKIFLRKASLLLRSKTYIRFR
jgi:hypothetical protein